MGRSLNYCVNCGTEMGFSINPPCLCPKCDKAYPWAAVECENAWAAGYAHGWNDAQRGRFT